MPPSHSVPVGHAGLTAQCVSASTWLAAHTKRKLEVAGGIVGLMCNGDAVGYFDDGLCDGLVFGDVEIDGGFVCLVGLDVGGLQGISGQSVQWMGKHMLPPAHSVPVGQS